MVFRKSTGNRNEVCLGLLIPGICKIVMHEYWYDCIKRKYGDKSNYASQTVTDGFIVHIKSESIYADLYGDVEQIFDTSNYEVQKPPAIEKKN